MGADTAMAITGVLQAAAWSTRRRSSAPCSETVLGVLSPGICVPSTFAVRASKIMRLSTSPATANFTAFTSRSPGSGSVCRGKKRGKVRASGKLTPTPDRAEELRVASQRAPSHREIPGGLPRRDDAAPSERAALTGLRRNHARNAFRLPGPRWAGGGTSHRRLVRSRRRDRGRASLRRPGTASLLRGSCRGRCPLQPRPRPRRA